MRGNPITRPASARPYDPSGPIPEVPRPARMDSGADQRERQPDAEPEWAASPSPTAETLEGLAAELSDLLWRRQEWPPATTSHRSRAQNPGLWRDKLLAEIEDLAGELNRKVARYSSVRAVQAPEGPSSPTDAAAVAWIHQTLEDIKATALGLEIASREAFIRAGMAEEQRLNVETAHGRKTGTVD